MCLPYYRSKKNFPNSGPVVQFLKSLSLPQQLWQAGCMTVQGHPLARPQYRVPPQLWLALVSLILIIFFIIIIKIIITIINIAIYKTHCPATILGCPSRCQIAAATYIKIWLKKLLVNMYSNSRNINNYCNMESELNSKSVLGCWFFLLLSHEIWLPMLTFVSQTIITDFLKAAI